MATSKDFCCFDRKFVFLYGCSHYTPPWQLGITEDHLHTYWWQMFWHAAVVVVVVVVVVVALLRMCALSGSRRCLDNRRCIKYTRRCPPPIVNAAMRHQLGCCSTAINYLFIMNEQIEVRKINCCLPFREGRRYTHNFCNGNFSARWPFGSLLRCDMPQQTL